MKIMIMTNVGWLKSYFTESQHLESLQNLMGLDHVEWNVESSNNNKNNPLLTDMWASPKISGDSIGRKHEKHEEKGDISLSAQNKNDLLFSSKESMLADQQCAKLLDDTSYNVCS